MGAAGVRRQCHLDRLEDRCGIDGCLAARQEVLVGLSHGDFLDTIEFAHNVGPFGLAPVQGGDRQGPCATAVRGRSRTGGPHHITTCGQPDRSSATRERSGHTVRVCVAQSFSDQRACPAGGGSSRSCRIAFVGIRRVGRPLARARRVLEALQAMVRTPKSPDGDDAGFYPNASSRTVFRLQPDLSCLESHGCLEPRLRLVAK